MDLFQQFEDVNGDGLRRCVYWWSCRIKVVCYIPATSIMGRFIKSMSQPWEIDKASEDMGCLIY